MAEPIPILLMVRELGIGGCERDLAKIAKHLDRSRYIPHVAAFHTEGLRTEELRGMGIPVLPLPVRSFRSWSAVLGARIMGRYIREHGIRLVHAYDVPASIFAVGAARAYKVPVIASQLGYRDLFPLEHRMLMRVADRLAARVLVNSAAVQEHLVRDEHVPRAKTYLCHNGVETDVFHPAPPGAPRVNGLSGLVIGSLCALRQEKRMDWLMRAFAAIRPAAPSANLVIVGSGPMLGELEQLRDGLGLGESCLLQPAQTDVTRWLQAMDVFVLPSSSESFPNALLEAMACGCCVVASSTGGVPELVHDGTTGLLFETSDLSALEAALRRVTSDSALRARLAVAAAVSAREEFSIEIAARRTADLYDQVLLRTSVGYAASSVR